MKRIGIISENFDNDSKSLRNLLSNRYSDKDVQFLPILSKFNGYQLERIRKLLVALKSEIITRKIDYLILMRDLDGLPSEIDEIKKRNTWFNKIEKGVSKECVRFLIIYELEALILADIDSFNKIYQTKYQLKTSPKFQSEPKELLKKITFKSQRKYKESDTPEIFQQLNFQNLYQNHTGEHSFQSFIDELTTNLN
ncbi:MAG: DUF4276 family protein [Bacteroidota bacterium]